VQEYLQPSFADFSHRSLTPVAVTDDYISPSAGNVAVCIPGLVAMPDLCPQQLNVTTQSTVKLLEEKTDGSVSQQPLHLDRSMTAHRNPEMKETTDNLSAMVKEITGTVEKIAECNVVNELAGSAYSEVEEMNGSCANPWKEMTDYHTSQVKQEPDRKPNVPMFQDTALSFSKSKVISLDQEVDVLSKEMVPVNVPQVEEAATFTADVQLTHETVDEGVLMVEDSTSSEDVDKFAIFPSAEFELTVSETQVSDVDKQLIMSEKDKVNPTSKYDFLTGCWDQELRSAEELDVVSAITGSEGQVSLLLPCFVQLLENQTVAVGSVATFNCTLQHCISLIWSKDGKNISTGDRIMISVDRSGLRHSLSIADVQLSDAGQYSATLPDESPVESSSAMLTVLQKQDCSDGACGIVINTTESSVCSTSNDNTNSSCVDHQPVVEGEKDSSSLQQHTVEFTTACHQKTSSLLSNDHSSEIVVTNLAYEQSTNDHDISACNDITDSDSAITKLAHEQSTNDHDISPCNDVTDSDSAVNELANEQPTNDHDITVHNDVTDSDSAVNELANEQPTNDHDITVHNDVTESDSAVNKLTNEQPTNDHDITVHNDVTDSDSAVNKLASEQRTSTVVRQLMDISSTLSRFMTLEYIADGGALTQALWFRRTGK
jgi:hypothetical protein